MIEQIKTILNQYDAITAWIINETSTQSIELFMIKDKLDMNRGTDIHEFEVRIYVDFNEDDKLYKGDATLNISVNDSESEIKEKIELAIYAASFVKNDWYELPKNDDNDYPAIKDMQIVSNFKTHYQTLSNTFFGTHPYQSKVNSCEFFAIQGYTRVISSHGTNCTYPKNQFSFELVTDNDCGSEAVEIFKIYNLTTIDIPAIAEIVKQQLVETDGRAQAKRAQALKDIRVIISGEAVERMMSFYLKQATASTVYRKVSRAEIGKNFQGDQAVSPLTITIDPALASSIHARPVDEEGKKLSCYPLIENGTVKNLRGSARFCHYLNINNNGDTNTFTVKPGSQSYNDFTSEPHIEIIAWSDFQMRFVAGDIGGEYRLAKYFDGKTTHYLTGGSLAENMFKIQSKMMLTKELSTQESSITPKAIIIDHLDVAAG